jgi:hypothetical protein
MLFNYAIAGMTVVDDRAIRGVTSSVPEIWQRMDMGEENSGREKRCGSSHGTPHQSEKSAAATTPANARVSCGIISDSFL